MRKATIPDETLTKRLRYLWTEELFASFFVPAVLAFDAWLFELPAARAPTGSLFSSSLDTIAGLGLYALPVLEQVNCYHWQLMYDYPPDWRDLLENKRLKRSSLNRALEELDDEAGASTDPAVSP
jgi:hypothetical protein